MANWRSALLLSAVVATHGFQSPLPRGFRAGLRVGVSQRLRECSVMSDAASAPVPKEMPNWWELPGATLLKDVGAYANALQQDTDRLIVLRFKSANCKPCQEMARDFHEIIYEYSEKPLVFYDIVYEDNKVLFSTLGIKVLPFMHFYRAGEFEERRDPPLDAFHVAPTTIDVLKERLDLHLSGVSS